MIKSNTNYPTISIISQGPGQASKPPLSNGGSSYQHQVFQKQNSHSNIIDSMNSSSKPVLTKKHNSAKILNNKDDLIEQYDYIQADQDKIIRMDRNRIKIQRANNQTKHGCTLSSSSRIDQREPQQNDHFCEGCIFGYMYLVIKLHIFLESSRPGISKYV